jgi:cell division protease FtsH
MLNLTRERAKNFIAFLMGGRCAEELVFKEITNGASNDIEKATSLAFHMVCDWGMSDKMGPINFKKPNSNPFLSRIPGAQQDYSEKTSESIDNEVRFLIDSNYQEAMGILKENREALDKLAEALIIWETLDWAQVEKIISGKDIGVPIITKKPEIKEDQNLTNAPEKDVIDSKKNNDSEAKKELDKKDDPLLA